MKRTLGFLSGLAAAIAGCGDGTGPTERTTVSIRPCAVNAPASGTVWLAYRNGAGPWTQLSADAAGMFTFVAESRASIAYSYPGPESRRETRIVNATGPQLALLGAAPCNSATGSVTLSGSATTSGDGASLISIANRSLFVSLVNGQGSWTINQLPATAADLVATGASEVDERWIVRRGIVPANQTIPVLDFRGTEAHATQANSVTMTGGPTGGTTDLASRLKTAGGTIHPMAVASGTTGALTFRSLASAQRDPNDLYSVTIQTRDALGRDFRYVHFGYSEPADRSVAFGPAMSAGTVSAVSAAPYPRMRAVLASQSGYPDAARANFLESFRAVRVTTTAAYLGSTPSNWELDVPDLSAAGYLKEWGVFDVPRIWEFEAIKGSVHVLEGGLSGKDETAAVGVRRTIQ